MAFKMDRAAERLAEIVRDAGEEGILRCEAYKILDGENLLPDSSQLRGQMVLRARVRRFGTGDEARYVHCDHISEKRDERSKCETLDIKLGPKGGTVTIKGSGIDSTFQHVLSVTIRRRI